MYIYRKLQNCFGLLGLIRKYRKLCINAVIYIWGFLKAGVITSQLINDIVMHTCKLKLETARRQVLFFHLLRFRAMRKKAHNFQIHLEET